MSEGKVYGDRFAVVPEGILWASGVSPTAKILWALYAFHADREGRCYPRRTLLAEALNVSHDTVSRAKKELIDAGLIRVKERFDESGRRTSDDVFLQGARRTGAEGDRRTGAQTGSRSRKNEIDTHRGTAKTGGTPDGPTWVRPTNFVEDLDQLPEKQVAPLADEEKAAAKERLRAMRGHA